MRFFFVFILSHLASVFYLYLTGVIGEQGNFIHIFSVWISRIEADKTVVNTCRGELQKELAILYGTNDFASTCGYTLLRASVEDRLTAISGEDKTVNSMVLQIGKAFVTSF